MSRGRPKEQEAIPWQKYTQEFLEVPTKPELGSKSVWHYDRSKSENGPYKTEHLEVFKTSNRSNAKTKMKVINKNIDYVISAKKIPGIPESAEWVELSSGVSFIDKYKQKYNLS